MTVRVLLVDDHPVVRSGLKGILAEEHGIEVVGEAGDGAEAVRRARALEPDVVVMDLQMPRADGAAAIEAIRGTHPEMPILVLTTYDTDGDVRRAVDAGATGYLLKDALPAELFDATRRTASGETVLASRVASKLLGPMRGPAEPALTSREIEILELVSSGMTNREIGRALHLSVATVKTHLLHIFEKLRVDDRTEAVTTALRRGILRLSS